MSTAALDFSPSAETIPAELRIPPRPMPMHPMRLCRSVEIEPAWREAMRWSLIALSASMAAGDVLLLLVTP